METVICKADSHNKEREEELIRHAGEVLRQGGLVAFPTETVYGLGADALKSEAAQKIYAAKGRPSDNPLIVHIADWEAVFKIAEVVPQKAQQLADAFWPGPLTMILPKTKAVPYETTGGLDTVAIRMPSHTLARSIIREAGGYVAAPSANTSGRPSPTIAEHVIEDMNGRIDMIVDGGSVGIGLESTIIDLSGTVPVILRPGAITMEMLSEVIGTVELDKGLMDTDSDARPKAPGMKYRHYAPKAQLIVVEGNEAAVAARIRELVEDYAEEKIGIICTREHARQYPHGIVKVAGAWEKEEDIARNLYKILREFDQLGVECIYSESFDTPRMGQAIMNRLLKAAGQNKIIV